VITGARWHSADGLSLFSGYVIIISPHRHMSPWVDRYGRIQDYLRISLTDRCNLRCSYCVPSNRPSCIPSGDLLTADEIVRVVGIMTRRGIRKLRFTGGEPTLRRDLVEIIARCSRTAGIEYIGLTTNGVLYSDMAADLKRAGLSGVNISLDSLEPETLRQVSGRESLHRVLKSIDTALHLGYEPVKINTVIMRGINEHEILDFVEWARELPLNVRFIEYMPFRGNRWDEGRMVCYDEVRARIETRYSLHPLPEAYLPGRIAEDFVIPGFRGTVSIIASMTRSFCSTCSRLRLTADGALKTCLFFPAQARLRPALRSGASDNQISVLIENGIEQKPSGHPEPEDLMNSDDLSMIEIGG
jgi:molybdenum cofactor biosynthesis protein A